ncbi:MAG: alpha/beta hydrolase family protein [Bacteroidota bacterium]
MYQKNLKLPVDNYYLDGTLSLPVQAKSIIIFTHGHGHNRFININDHIARHLNQAGFGTLLFDLIAADQSNYDKVWNDISLLSSRLMAVTLWLSSHSEYNDLKFAYFASGRGVPIAIKAATKLNTFIDAMVIADGHPEKVEPDYPQLNLPTFFIFGERESATEKLDHEKLKSMPGTKNMVIIPGTSGLFEEPGKLEVLTKYTLAWYQKYLPAGKPEVSLAGEILDQNATILK